MKKVVVLGAGMVGSAIAIDLSRDYSVTAVDLNQSNLNKLTSFGDIKCIASDISSHKKLEKIISESDLVIGAVPGFIGYQTLQTVISQGKDIVDISFFNEDPFSLDELAKKNNVTAVVDCGISPGLSNIILGHLNQKYKIIKYKCFVGGLPYNKSWPYNYKAFFSPSDVIEEYVRPARLVKDGEVLIKEALSDPELINFEEVGKLEAFNTDGLRTLLHTMKIPEMIEKTMRYPGHIELMKIFRETGFFGKDEIEVDGKKIKPIDVTSKLLFPFWKPEQEEDEFTLLQLEIDYIENTKTKKVNYKVFDRFDKETKTSSMARTTGYTCTAAARLVLEERFNRKGICPPEFIGEEPGCAEKIFSSLKKKNIFVNKFEFDGDKKLI